MQGLLKSSVRIQSPTAVTIIRLRDNFRQWNSAKRGQGAFWKTVRGSTSDENVVTIL
jgi:hypothetical protein